MQACVVRMSAQVEDLQERSTKARERMESLRSQLLKRKDLLRSLVAEKGLKFQAKRAQLQVRYAALRCDSWSRWHVRGRAIAWTEVSLSLAKLPSPWLVVPRARRTTACRCSLRRWS